MTAIIKKIKVGLSQEEIDDLKPFDGTYDGDIDAKGFISIQNKNITFGGAKSNSVEVSFKNGSRNGNSSEELAFLSDLVGGGVAQSVIDLGELSGSPQLKTFSWTKSTIDESGKLWESIYDEELYELLKNAKYMEFWTVQNDISYLWYLPVSVMRRKKEGTVNYLNITGSINRVSPSTFDTETFAFSITQLNSNTSGKKLYLSTTDVWDAINAFKIYY